jgi:ABC-type dipeptide/oligopeptide/nickel transport system permease subunit
VKRGGRKVAWTGAALVGLVVAFAVVGPWIAPHDPLASDFARGATALHTPVGPSSAFWLGADRVYRDVFARLSVAGRASLTIGVASTALATTLGGAVGVIAGWFEGTMVDVVLMRVVDVGLAFPFLLLVMAVGAALDRTTSLTVILVLGLTGWLSAARVVRAKTMQLRGLEFVVAARALGRSTPGILWSHVLPNVRGLLLTVATVSVAQMILAESALGYLGVGVAPPAPTWGRMLFEGQDYYLAAPWLVAAPATAIVVAVVGFHLLGEGLRDALDTRD